MPVPDQIRPLRLVRHVRESCPCRAPVFPKESPRMENVSEPMPGAGNALSNHQTPTPGLKGGGGGGLTGGFRN